MKKPERITAKWLRRLGADCSEVDKFARLYPKGARVILPSARQCARAELDIEWLAHRLWPWDCFPHKSNSRIREIYDNEVWENKGKSIPLSTPLHRGQVRAAGLVHAWRAWEE